jgi:hypothetical protein
LATAIIESKEAELRTPFLIILAILFLGLVLSGAGDPGTCIPDTDVANTEATSGVSKAGNSLASVIITITMYVVANE